MITTRRNSLGVKFNKRFRLKAFFSLIALLTVVACGNSKLLLGPLYNRFDDQMRKEFNKLGDFTDEQSRDIEQRLQTYHLWHRRQQLPRYAALRSCHPVNYSYDFMKSLTDKQLDFIEARFANEQKKNQKRYNSRTREERLQRRYTFITKWTGRAGFKWNDEQKELLRTKLLDYDKRMANQLNKLWNLLEDNETEKWSDNRQLWIGFFGEFEKTLTPRQRSWADGWVSKLARTGRDLSDDFVTFESERGDNIDPALGCV